VRWVGNEVCAKEVRQMGEPGPSGMRTRVGSGSNPLAGAIWLGAKQIRRKWVRYPLTGLLLLFLGFLVLPSVYGVSELRGFGAEGRRIEDFYNAYFVDCVFLVICAFLGANALSPGPLVFRGLPIPAGSLVGGRAVSLLFALVLNVPAFFLPAFFFSDLGELGASYVWFAGTWTGYVFVISGLVLFIGLATGGRAFVPISVCLGISLAFALALLEWTAGFGLVRGSAGLARDYGPLPALLSVLAGAAAFAILSRATADRLQKRGFS
jgi:hypothetical protein